MKAKLIVCISLMATLLGACGEKHTAKSLIKEFIQKYAQNADVEILSVSDIDSTAYVTSMAVKKMRQEAKTMKGLNANNIQYNVDEKNNKTLYYVKVKYVLTYNNNEKKDTCKQTFYMTPQITQIVAFKNN